MNDISAADTKAAPCVLAIDDEPELLDIVRQFLESDGFNVLTASDPESGLKLYENRWRDIDLVLLDYVMPDMNGDVVFEHLQNINPDVRVVLLTACDDHVAEPLFDRGLRGYISKPFYYDKFVQTIRDKIEAP